MAAAVAVGPRVLSRGGGAGAALGFSPGDGAAVRDPEWGEKEDAGAPRHPLPTPPAGEEGLLAGVRAWLPSLVAVGVVALVFAHWGLTAKDALSRGIFNFDSLWYHLPFAVEMAHSHSVTGIHYTETVFTNWFYPQNSELLHSVGILLTGRDTLSLFLNFGWLGLAFLAAWCIGRPYGRGSLTVVAAGVLLECHTLVVREPGAAKNDLMAAALLLAAIAILVNREDLPSAGGARQDPRANTSHWRSQGLQPASPSAPSPRLSPWPRCSPSRSIVLAPTGRRWAAAGWWFAAGLAGGGYWYLRNLIVTGNPLPQLEHLGPISLPHPGAPAGRPPRLQHRPLRHRHRRLARLLRARPAPGLRRPLAVVLLAALAGALVAIALGPPQGPPLDGRRSPRRHGRLRLHPAQRRRRRRRPHRLRHQHPLRHPSSPRRLDPPAGRVSGASDIPRIGSSCGTDPRADRMVPLGLVPPRGPARALAGHQPLRRRPARPGPSLRLARRPAGGADPGRPALRPPPRRAAAAPSSPASPRWASPCSRSATRSSATTCATASPTPTRKRASPACTSTPPTAGPATSTTRASASPAPPPASSSTASTAPTSPTASATSAPRARTAPSTRSRPAPASAPRSTRRTSTTWSRRRSSTSSNPATRSPRRRHAGCAASPRRSRSGAAARSPSGASTAAWTPRACGPRNAPLREIPNQPSA